jgi:ketosteroid isomerase-like protein
MLQVPALCAAPGSPKAKKSSIQHVALCPGLDGAYDVGSYVLSITKDGVPGEYHGKYVVIWKQEEGRWVAAVDIDNADSSN